MAERHRAAKELDAMGLYELNEHARNLEAEADELRTYRDRVQRALTDRLRAGVLLADLRPGDDAR
jgi:HPt (histidine-containing phosphotransfer) domain-containing protein